MTRHIRCGRGLRAIISAAFFCGAAAIVQGQEIDENYWRADTDRRVEKQISMMSDAYQLTEAEVSKLREDVRAQMNSAFSYEVDMRKQLKQLEMLSREPDAEEKTNGGQTILRAMQEAVDKHPLNEEKILEIAEKRLPAARSKAGRSEYQNLKLLEEARWNRTISGESTGQIFDNTGGTDTPPGGPVKDPKQTVIDVDQNSVILTPGGGSDDAKTPPSVDPQIISQMPPLDEWEAYVKTYAEKYEFTETQDAKAQSIMRECRSRATQYVGSKSADFERARGIADDKAREAELARLNEPIAAYFVELKNRLENIPDSQQIKKAMDKEKKPADTKK